MHKYCPQNTHVCYSLDILRIICELKAKQKQSRCKKSEVKLEAPVSFYSYTRLKSVISGRGQGPRCLLPT